MAALTALAIPNGVEDVIKSCLGLFNLLLKANQIVTEKTACFNFFLYRYILKITLSSAKAYLSSCLSILSPVGKLNNLPFELTGLTGARMIDPLEVISTPKLAIKQERRCTYLRKRNVRLIFLDLNIVPLR